MSENLSRYFESTGSPSVFDTILPPDQNVINVVAQENTIPDVPDAIRDLWFRPDPEAAVTMLTSPGILSNNDLVL